MRQFAGPTVQRFTVAQRIEHFLLIISFNVLAFTGLPQKYFFTPWAERIIQLMGGIERTRLIHRTFAVLLILQGLYHIGAVLAARRAGRERGAMGISFDDVRGLVGDLLYLAGVRRERPAFGRFDYRQKFEYWAVVWGTAIMAATGLIMWFPELLARVFPGVLVPAARVAHGGEALLAILAVILWHFYNAHFRPDIFPMDPAMWTGRINVDRLRHEHAAEYARLVDAGEVLPEVRELPAPPLPPPLPEPAPPTTEPVPPAQQRTPPSRAPAAGPGEPASAEPSPREAPEPPERPSQGS